MTLNVEDIEKNMIKKKITLIENTIPPYRVPLYNSLSQIYNLRVIYSYGEIPDDIQFETVNVPVKKCGPFFIHKKNLVNIINDSEIVIGMFCVSWLSIMILPFMRLKQKVIFWGMGVAGSVTNKYDHSSIKYLILYKCLLKKVNAAIFYSDYPKKKYLGVGINPGKMFIAYNTVFVERIIIDNTKKKNFLFIGSLYKSKKVDYLINQYQIAFNNLENLPSLLIVGDGDERKSLENLSIKNKLENKIQFLGSIIDEEKLVELFSQTILCISPGQAGLSVQKAMGYGVPFVTTKTAFTGGEIFDIKDGINGVLLEDESMISSLLIDVVHNTDKYLAMGQNAYDYYWNNRTLNHMIKGFKDAIEYVISDENEGKRELDD